MTDRDTKEKITKSRCRFDLKSGNISFAVLCGIFAIVFGVFVWRMTIKMEHDLVFWMLVVSSVVFIALLLMISVYAVVSYIKYSRYDFLIIEDTVRETYVRHRYRERVRLCIFFDRCGEYAIPFENYMWSELSKATDEDIYGVTNHGDEFYVVARKSRTRKGAWIPLMAYNKKFFVISEKSFEQRKDGWYPRKTDE